MLFFSDRDGWSARQDRLAAALACEGAFVVGIDLPTYLAKLAGLSGKCSYPAGHVEEVAHWIERHEGFATYTYPLVVGDGAGATFAYALAAQAPAGTFAGLVTLGWDACVSLAERILRRRRRRDDGRRRRCVSRRCRSRNCRCAGSRSRSRPGARLVGSLADARVGASTRSARCCRALALREASADARRDVRALAPPRGRGARRACPTTSPILPITDIPPTKGDAHRIAIIITGDGGWAGLDRGVADALNADGVRVIGFSTLKFFWHKQTPDAAAASDRAHHRALRQEPIPHARFVLIGYSFGASLVPVVANRLPDAARARVDGGVLISPDDEAVFEIHVGDWFGSTHHDEALPIGPEMAASKVPLVCVHGADENDSFCMKPQPAHVHVVTLPGGHHYNGDYVALGNLIVKNLPSQGARVSAQRPPKMKRR